MNNTESNLISAFLESDSEQLKKDYSSVREIKASNKDFLYRQGDSCSDVFWIKDGVVKLSYVTEKGAEITIAVLGKGSVIGGFSDAPANPEMEESAQALGEVTFYRIAKSDFKALMSHQSELAWHVLEEIYTRKQKIERKLRTVLTQSVETRIVATLIELSEVFGITCTHGYALEIHLTQQELADLVGASRSVVSTALNDFRSRGILDYTREQLCINDTALRSLLK